MPEPKRPLKVFLCHAHSDLAAVRVLYSRLKREGVDAWLDKEKLLPGQDWEYEIRKAVRETDVVVVCLSKQFNQAGFRQKEVRIALDTAMEQPEGEIFIIPARLEECENLESLSKWHWVDLFEANGYQSLIRALRARADRIGAALRIRKGGQSSISRPRSKEPEKTTEPPTNGLANGDTFSEIMVVTKISETQNLEKAKLEEDEKITRENSESEAAEKAELEKAVREKEEFEIDEKVDREKTEREAAEKVAREKAEREIADRTARERAKREADEKVAREKAEREAAEKAVHEKAAREKAEREKEERETAEKSARKKTERDAAEKVIKEKKEQEIAERPKPSGLKPNHVDEKTSQTNSGEKAVHNTKTKPKNNTPFVAGFLRLTSVLGFIGFVAVMFLINRAINNANKSPTLVPTLMKTSPPEISVSPSRIPAPSNTPTQHINVSPTVLPVGSPVANSGFSDNPQTLYFISSDKFLYALDMASGSTEKVILTEYEDNSDYYFSSVFWFSNSEIMVWASSGAQIINLVSGQIKNVTQDTEGFGFGSSDLSNDDELVIYYRLSGLLVSNINSQGILTSPKDVGMNLSGYFIPYCMKWRPNGSAVALIVSGRSQQYANLIIDTPSLAYIRIGFEEEPTIIKRNVDSCVSWSPDGKYITFGNGKPRDLSIYYNSVQHNNYAEGIFTVELQTGVTTKLSDTNGYDPVWSSDGNSIAFLTDKGISIVNVNTKEESQLYSGNVLALLWGK